MRFVIALAFVSVMLSPLAEAKFGGSRSSGSSSSSSSSRGSFGGFRSSGSSAPSVSRSIPRTNTVVEHNTTVIHHDSGGSNGLFTGMLIGNMLGRSSQPTVVVADQQPSVVVQQQDSGHPVFWTLFWVALIGGVGYYVYTKGIFT